MYRCCLSLCLVSPQVIKFDLQCHHGSRKADISLVFARKKTFNSNEQAVVLYQVMLKNCIHFGKLKLIIVKTMKFREEFKKKKLVVIIPDTTISSVACTEPSQEDNIISGSMSRGLASETNLGRHPGGEAR